MSIFDRFKKASVDNLVQKEIVATEKPKIKSEEPIAFKSSDYDSANRKWDASRELSPQKRREIALTAPFFMKASMKKNMDKIRSWFEFENINTGKPPSEYDKKIIQIFNKKTNIKYKWLIANICADIYGDGFILKKYDDDIYDKNGKLKSELAPVGKIANLELVNPEFLTEMKYLNSEYEKKGILHYYYHNSKSNVEYFIHPNRIIHIKDDELPFSKLGISKVDILKNIIMSEKDIDIAVGEILKWFSHGIVEFTKEGLQPKEKEEMLKVLATHPNYFANSDKYKMNVYNPTAIQPKEFFEYIILTIASTFTMPTQILTGVQIGKTTGAETGFSDYYRDIKDKQELIDTPLLELLYEEVLGVFDRNFKYITIWNDIYVGELAEAELMGKRAATIQLLMSTNPPIITRAEAREIFNKGDIYLNPDDPPEKIESKDVVDDTTKNSKIKEENPKQKIIKQMKDEILNERQEMIEKRKLLEIARKERELGKEIEKEQDKLFGEKGKAFKSEDETFGK